MSRRKSKKMCCECIHWEMGDTWGTNPCRKPNTPVCISEGWCKSPGRKRPKQKWSHCPACDHFDEAPRNGIIFCGQGEPTADVLNRIMAETAKLLSK